jgi:hypothetical protein
MYDPVAIAPGSVPIFVLKALSVAGYFCPTFLADTGHENHAPLFHSHDYPPNLRFPNSASRLLMIA